MNPSELSAWRRNERSRLLREREGLAPEALAELRSRIDHHLERAFPDLVLGILAFFGLTGTNTTRAIWLRPCGGAGRGPRCRSWWPPRLRSFFANGNPGWNWRSGRSGS